MKKAVAEDPVNSSMIKKLISKTTNTKQKWQKWQFILII